MENEWLTFILEHPSPYWSWGYLSANPNLFWSDVVEHPEVPWSFSMMSMNPNITLETILRNAKKGWSRFFYSSNANFRYEHMALWDATFGDTDTTCWNVMMVSKQPSITLEIVNAHPEFRWNPLGLLCNPSIGEVIRTHPIYGRLVQNKIARKPNRILDVGVCDEVDTTWDKLIDAENGKGILTMNHGDFLGFSTMFMSAYEERRATTRCAMFKEELLQVV